jgi:ornithine cyclodeaminase
MPDRDVLILRGGEVESALDGREREIIETVAESYKTHAAGESSLPTSLFLRFPASERDRIIALPAYIGGGFDVAGVKWVSSFPGNLGRGLNRASAVIVLNSSLTGVPEVVMEGSVVSAKRTAASAALAATTLHGGDVRSVGFVGCGPINFETARFLLAASPSVEEFVLFDVEAARARQFAEKCRGLNGALKIQSVPEIREVLRGADVISFATTAATPHLFDLSACRRGSTVLHISLRDFAPEVILACDNVVDDVDHVCRERTSVHLAGQLTGSRDFIRCTLAEVLNGTARAKSNPDDVTIFSPFGLGVLDLAVGQLAVRLAHAQGFGTTVESFLPGPYGERD